MSTRTLCIHGHFYQPPREDPWLGAILPEGTAAPSENWNARIVEESYAPLGWARRMDSGRITDIVNCYEWMNFNVGPTLLAWLQREQPAVYERILDGDRASVARWGHGNAMAQAYHHIILPLATERDRRIEVAWSVADFRARYGRAPEGMWLAETAVDVASLEILADHDIRYTILAPNQAKAVDLGEGWRDVNERSLDISRPYFAELPSGREVAIFFYNGPLSRAVAFEGLLKDGEAFWRRLSGQRGSLVSLGTDGETYGHHFPFGEMALAYVLEQAQSGRDGFELTNYAAYLANHPPTRKVRIRENTSWSCVHGIERWRSNCGCVSGGPGGQHQRWRAPLRAGLDALKARLDDHFDSRGALLFKDPDAALLGYGEFLGGAKPGGAYAKKHFKSGLSADDRCAAWRLLEMQGYGLSMFASCAWFFNDLSRVEPRNGMTFGMRAAELAAATGAGDPLDTLLGHLETAEVNDERFDTGRELFEQEVRPRARKALDIAAQGLLTLRAEGRLPGKERRALLTWPDVTVAAKGTGPDTGLVTVTWLPEQAVREFSWRIEAMGPAPLEAKVFLTENGEGDVADPRTWFWKNQQAVVLAWLAVQEQGMRESLVEGAAWNASFLPCRVQQHGPQQARVWPTAWEAMAWMWVIAGSGRGNGDFAFWLREVGGQHPGRAWLEHELGQAVLQMVLAEPANVAAIADILRRAEEIGLAPKLWEAQNAWFARHGGPGSDTEATGLLGF